MENNDSTESAIAVAWAIFDLFEVVGDETIYHIDPAIDLIESYAARRVRESRRPRRGKVVPLRVVGR
jgi:hypothetical protein